MCISLMKMFADHINQVMGIRFSIIMREEVFHKYASIKQYSQISTERITGMAQKCRGRYNNKKGTPRKVRNVITQRKEMDQ